MGFSCKSNGFPINPGEKLTFPIAAEELSVLDLQWSSTDAQELDFSLSFTPAEGGDENVLVMERQTMRQDKLDIQGPGNCILEWKNCPIGWFGGSVCTVTYTATLQSKREIEEEQQRVAEVEEEQRRKEAELLAAELRAQEMERLRVRREEREDKIERYRAEAAESQICLAETRKSLARGAAEIARLQEMLAAAEEEHSAEVAMASALETDISTALEAINVLMAEEKEDYEANGAVLDAEGHSGAACVDANAAASHDAAAGFVDESPCLDKTEPADPAVPDGEVQVAESAES